MIAAPEWVRFVTPASYVPISQLARYFSCSFVSVSIRRPVPASLRRAILLVSVRKAENDAQ